MDADVFSFTNDQSKLDINVFSNSGTKAGVYNLQFKVENPGYNNEFTFDITVKVVEICNASPNIDYELGSAGVAVPAFESTCVNQPTIQSVQYSIENTQTSASFIVFDGSQSFSIQTNDENDLAVYKATILTEPSLLDPSVPT